MRRILLWIPPMIIFRIPGVFNCGCGSGWVFLDVDGMSMGSSRFLEGRKSSCARCARAGLSFLHEDKCLPVWILPSQLSVDFGFVFGCFLEVVN